MGRSYPVHRPSIFFFKRSSSPRTKIKTAGGLLTSGARGRRGERRKFISRSCALASRAFSSIFKKKKNTKSVYRLGGSAPQSYLKFKRFIEARVCGFPMHSGLQLVPVIRKKLYYNIRITWFAPFFFHWRQVKGLD